LSLIRLRFADAFASPSKVCLSLVMCPGFLTVHTPHIFRTHVKPWRVFFEKDLFEKRKNSSKRLGKHHRDGRSQDRG
jgi:hypothetical protein